MFQKLLIANRSEIAVRIIRTCKEMGIKSVAIYSEADRISPHVLKADEAYCIGPSPSSKSYLNIDSILEVIEKSKADAIHPGYGFLSENSYFAELINKKNITWIGPSVDSIKKMGDKMLARKIAIKAGASIVPGSKEAIVDLDDAKNIIKKIGYPILLKAAGGGGGKGMRIIYSDDELYDAIRQARMEAEKSFSDNRIYIEKYLDEPHHIEIQILSDNFGNMISLGERECSIQRRYQKIIEETPSPFIDNNLRNKISNLSLKIARSCNYSGVGTLEFLIDKQKNIYFLEMNTRLQVEHPITEMTTNVDLVKEQICVAYGKKLSFTQKEIIQQGHSIECRIYAEDGFNNFLPSTGKITDLSLPNGYGVRVDEGVRIGQDITPYYDPLLAKLITWGKDRNEAINRMLRALDEFQVGGLETNIPFCLSLIKHKSFLSGNYSTKTIDVIKNELLEQNNIHKEKQTITTGVSAVHHQRSQHNSDLTNEKNINNETNWLLLGRQEQLR